MSNNELGMSNHELCAELVEDDRQHGGLRIGTLVRLPNGALHHIIGISREEPYDVIGERVVIDLYDDEV